MDHTITGVDQSNFQTFFGDWETRLELYLHQLLGSLDEQDESKLQQLIHQVLTHYHEYYLAKAQVCRQNGFLVLSPPWFTSYERTFFWLGGFKPSLATIVVKKCRAELSSDQLERVERLRNETKDEETEMSEKFASVENQILSPEMLVFASMAGGEVNGMTHDVDAAVDRLAEDVEFLVACADYLREKTVAKLVGILSTAQTVRFLAAMVQFEMTIRRWGQRKEARNA